MFRSRKRGREIPKAASVKAHVAAEAAAAAPAEKHHHPVAAFANTVYVDPVIKVRERPSPRPEPDRRFSHEPLAFPPGSLSRPGEIKSSTAIARRRR